MKTLEETFLEPLHDALMKAFPNEGDLAQMVQFKLQTNLNSIGGNGLSDKVFRLIEWAKSHAGIRDLAEKASSHNTDNRNLQLVAKNIRVFHELEELNASENGNSLHPLIEKLWFICSSPKYRSNPDIFLSILQIIPKIRTELVKHIQLNEIINKILAGEFDKEWELSKIVGEYQPIFISILQIVLKDLPPLEIEDSKVSIILVVMTKDEAIELDHGNVLKYLSPEIQKDFDELKDTLIKNGADDWIERYGETAKDWQPFGKDTETIEALIQKEIAEIRGKDSSDEIEFIDIISINQMENRHTLKKLREKDCVVILDSVSICHPGIHSNFHESVLDVYKSTFVINIAPVHYALEKLKEMSFIIQLKIANMEFAKRIIDKDEDYGTCEEIHEKDKFGRWFTDRVSKMAHININERFFNLK